MTQPTMSEPGSPVLLLNGILSNEKTSEWRFSELC